MPTTPIDCPRCGRALRLPESAAGRQVQCASCGTTFEVPPLAPEAVMPQLSLDDDSTATIAGVPQSPAPLRPVLVEPRDLGDTPADSDTAPCPYCRAPVRRHAQYCRSCGEDLEPDKPEWERRWALRRDQEPHRGQLVLFTGGAGMCLSFLPVANLLGVPLSIASWVMAHKDLQQMALRTMDPRGRSLTEAGKACGIIGTVVGLMWVIVLLCGGLGVRL